MYVCLSVCMYVLSPITLGTHWEHLFQTYLHGHHTFCSKLYPYLRHLEHILYTRHSIFYHPQNNHMMKMIDWYCLRKLKQFSQNWAGAMGDTENLRPGLTLKLPVSPGHQSLPRADLLCWVRGAHNQTAQAELWESHLQLRVAGSQGPRGTRDGMGHICCTGWILCPSSERKINCCVLKCIPGENLVFLFCNIFPQRVCLKY